MSSSSSQINDPVPRDENANQKELVNLNEAMQQSLQRFQNIRNSNIIIRCENLPVMEGATSGMSRAFDEILGMIVPHPPSGSKLFLHIDCEQERMENGDPARIRKVYTIHFHTNCQADETWRMANRETIENCSLLLAQYGASFTMNNIKASGCLFSISLPGKM
ncbi:MAG: hypothetical protein ACXVKI_06770 [Flavisolibacter sp.]